MAKNKEISCFIIISISNAVNFHFSKKREKEKEKEKKAAATHAKNDFFFFFRDERIEMKKRFFHYFSRENEASIEFSRKENEKWEKTLLLS